MGILDLDIHLRGLVKYSVVMEFSPFVHLGQGHFSQNEQWDKLDLILATSAAFHVFSTRGTLVQMGIRMAHRLGLGVGSPQLRRRGIPNAVKNQTFNDL